MGDKDVDELFGKAEILICDPNGEMKPLGKVVENSTRLNPEDVAELDRLSVRENMQVEPLRFNPQSLSCDFQMSIDDSLASFLGADFASEPSKQVCSFVITGKPKINKPRNLKYPNKKRAKRVWKKWAKRYGTRPGNMIYLPNVEVESEYNGDCVSVNVKPIKKD